MIINPTKENYLECYRHYRMSGTFNKDCSVYQEQSKLSERYKDKCVWLQIFENDLEKLAGGVLTFPQI